VSLFSQDFINTKEKKLYFRDFCPLSYTLIEGYGGILFLILCTVFIFWRHFNSDIMYSVHLLATF